ncbi:MAG: HD domain-containing protein [Lachnospiraceae bacterium]|nr:HD domain-containing protein [Lachnospiraceae bacterium]
MAKHSVFAFELNAGQIVAEDVFSVTGQLIVPAGTRLDEDTVHKIQMYNVSMVQVSDGEFTPTPAVMMEEPHETYSQRIKKSLEFQQFKAAYLKNIEEFHGVINEIVEKNLPMNPKDLLAKTAYLLDTSSSSTLHVFDMLQNMREYDDTTYTHCINVAMINRVFGIWLGMSQSDVESLTLAGLLHDIGKLATPDYILNKPARLTEEEYALVKDHATAGYNYLKNQAIDPRVKEAVLFHHERGDGSGYPYGLTQDQIPEFAKITAIADVYDAMTAKRVYREPICPFVALRYIEQDGFVKYDPKYLMTFMRNVVSTYINMTVQLSNGQIGDVIMINQHAPSRPLVKIGKTFIDLSTRRDLDIERIV